MAGLRATTLDAVEVTPCDEPPRVALVTQRSLTDLAGQP